MDEKKRNKLIVYISILFLFATVLLVFVSSSTYAFLDNITSVDIASNGDAIIEFENILESTTTDFSISFNRSVNREYMTSIIFTPTYFSNKFINNEVIIKVEKLVDDSYEEVKSIKVTKNDIGKELVFNVNNKELDNISYYKLSLYIDGELQDIRDENVSGDLDIKVYSNYYFIESDNLYDFIAQDSGTYKVELWGAAGIKNGAYTSGLINLSDGDKFYIHVGNDSTDIRLNNDNFDHDLSINSRIMIAGIGGISTDGVYGLNGYFGNEEYGSSYISGYNGMNAISSSNDTSLKCEDVSNVDCSIHYSGLYFTDAVLSEGVNDSTGYAKITYLNDNNLNPISESILKKEIGNSSVVVHHYLKNTETKISDDDEYIGKIGDSYVVKEKDIDGYLVANVPENNSGLYSSNVVEVIYYYDYVSSAKSIVVKAMIAKDVFDNDIIYTLKLVGNGNMYTKELVFNKEEVARYFEEHNEDSFMEKSVSFDDLVVSDYTLYETQSDDYECEGTINVVNGTITGNVVNFKLIEKSNNYSVSFINSKIEDK